MEAARLDRFNRLNYKSCPWHTKQPRVLFQHIRAANARFLESRDLHLHGWDQFNDDHYLWCCSVAIFTSNCIEDTGLSLSDTQRLVMTSLRGGELAEVLPTSQRLRDVSQHAAAFSFLCRAKLGQPLSVELVLDTHRILMAGSKREDGFEVPAGQFRAGEVIIGRHNQACVPPALAQKLIEALVVAYNKHKDDFDPFVLAAWLKHVFVHIHPFDDGNGRLSRLPFPVSLLRGGFNHKDKKNYQSCVAHGPPVGSIAKSLEYLLKSFSAFVLESVHSHWCSFWERARFVFPCRLEIPVPPGFLPLPWLTSAEQEDFEPTIMLSEAQNYVDKQSYSGQAKEEVIRKVALERALACVTYSRRVPSPHHRESIARILRPVVIGEPVNDSQLLAELRGLHEEQPGVRRPEETLGMARAYHYLCERSRAKELSVELIIDTHKHLMPIKGGLLRTNDAYIGAHLFPPACSIADSLESLVLSFNRRRAETRASSQDGPCVLAAWLMYELLAIHPFEDGNGRLSRLLLNWVLLSFGMPFPVTFDSEPGALKSAHKKLMAAIVAGRLFAGCPSVLATRVLLSVRNTWQRIYSELDMVEEQSGNQERITSVSN
ncbi:Fido domain-containing protein [Balamuthia mandrillaris]